MEQKGIEFSLTETFIKKYKGKQPAWGPLGLFTFRRTYARTLDTGKLEEFWQCLQRVVEATFLVQKIHCSEQHIPWDNRKAQISAQEMFKRMWAFKFLPPGRGLANMGARVMWERGGACLNNCGFVSTKDIDTDFSGPFTWLMSMSMHGCGVGFDTLGSGAEMYLRRPRMSREPHIAEDSREGWVDCFRRVLDAFTGSDTLPKSWDFSKIRPEGSPIKTFGGIAPGPGPLKKLIDKTQEYLERYQEHDQLVDTTLIVDIMNFAGEAVVSGGVRRTAEIAIGSPDDEEFLRLKNKEFMDDPELARWASNNTLNAVKGMDYTSLALSSVTTGEPGYWWQDTAKRYGRLKDTPNGKDRRAMGLNPCVSGDTLILTNKGYQRIDETLYPVIIWNGKRWSTVHPKITGYHQRLFRVTLSDSTYLDCTPNHKWHIATGKQWQSFVVKQTQDLNIGDRLVKFEMPEIKEGNNYSNMYCQGFYAGDGQGTKKSIGALIYDHSADLLEHFKTLGCTVGKYQSKYHRTWVGMSHLNLNEKYFVPLNGNLNSKLEFLSGLLDSDGTVLTNPNSKMLQISNTNLDFLNQVRLMLTTIGVQAKVTQSRPDRQNVSMPGGNYNCKAQYRLLVNSQDTYRLIKLGLKSWHHSLPCLKPQRDARRFVTVTQIQNLGVIDKVYCFTELQNHTGTFNGIVTGQCGEQTLENKELCNLVETFPANHDDIEDYLRTLKFAYMYAKTVTLIKTHSKQTNAVMQRNRRIGLSQSGIVQQINKVGFREHVICCDTGYDTICHWDEVYSDWLCISKSIKKTTVKPSGTVSLLVGATPGIHYPHSKYYIRRIRVPKQSGVWEQMKKAGYKVEPDKNLADSTVVIEFPVEEKDFVWKKSDISVWEQLELAAQMQYYWSDNQVSITVTVKPEETADAIKALAMYDTRLKCVTFLPVDPFKQYEQAPYEEITKTEFNKRTKLIKKMKLEIQKEIDRHVDVFCDGDSCVL